MCLRGRRKLEVCGLAVVTEVGLVPLAVTGQSVRSLGHPGALYMYVCVVCAVVAMCGFCGDMAVTTLPPS